MISSQSACEDPLCVHHHRHKLSTRSMVTTTVGRLVKRPVEFHVRLEKPFHTSFITMQQRIKITWLTFALYLTLLSSGHGSKVDDLPKDLDDARIGSEKGALHIVSTTQCDAGYLTYQVWAQKYSLEMVNQPGRFTRVISCDHPEVITEEDLSYMDTMFAPDWSIHPATGEDYKFYNRPVALMYWLAERKPTAEWTLILDPDMYFRQPFLLKDFEVPEGCAVAAYYYYMIGANRNLTEIHLPEILPRRDEYGGPIGRTLDMAGAFYLIRTKDLVKVAPLWLKYTKDLREDPRTINYTGVPEQVGQKEWVSEMYGYILAAAAVGIWHKLEVTAQYYHDSATADFPVILHYGRNHSTIGNDYYFVKHDHTTFDHTKCPPWNMSFHREQKQDGGLFPHPPFPDALPELPPREKYGKLLIIEVVTTLNQALCARHRRRCPPSVQLEKECGRVDAIAAALKVEFDKLHVPGVVCHDDSDSCKQMAEKGDCQTRWIYMSENCRASCNLCRTYIPRLVEMRLPINAVTFDKTQDYNKRVQTLKNQETVSRDILRCQELSLKSLVADFACRRLARAGAISLDESKVDEISFEQSTVLLRGSSDISVYSALILAIGLVGSMLLIRKYLGGNRNTTLLRHK